MTGSGGLYFWLGASADADRVLSPAAPEPVVSAHSGNARLRYEIGEVAVNETHAAVFDMERGGECFCLIDPSDCLGGLPTALARAQDIADIFNWSAK